MLIIDPERGVTSSRVDAALFPYVLMDFRGQALKASIFLARATNMDRLAPLLLKELFALSEVSQIGSTRPALILEEAARWVANGAIPVAQTLRDDTRLVVWTDALKQADAGLAVRFADVSIARDFVRRWLKDPAARADIEAMLASQQDPGLKPPVTAGALEGWIAEKLMARLLGFFPVNGDAGVLRLSWIAHNILVAIEPPAPPPPPPPPPAAPIVLSSQSTLPDLPAEISAQAQTMMDAAAAGVPFCEECARAAAALAAANA